MRGSRKEEGKAVPDGGPGCEHTSQQAKECNLVGQAKNGLEKQKNPKQINKFKVDLGTKEGNAIRLSRCVALCKL